MLYRPVTIGRLTIPGNLFLAPLAGYSEAAFRSICVEQGASLCFTEMVSAEGLCRGCLKTRELLRRAENETLLGVQLFASNAPAAARAARLISPLGFALIDLNCGCSVPKVIKAGCGSALLREPAKIREILMAIRGESVLPLTVKLRSGWDSKSLNYLETSAMAVEGGADAVALHPRTRAQGFTGRAAWGQLSELKKACPLPVLGSGDLFSAEAVQGMIEQTGCDGVMLARGAIGNPFLFDQAYRLLTRGEPPQPPAVETRLQTALRHLQLAVRFKGERLACLEFRKHFSAYTKGIPGAARLRRTACRAESLEAYTALVRDFLEGRGESP